LCHNNRIMAQGVKLSTPYVSEGKPGRYGRDFHEESVGSGRIEEAAPEDMAADANVVSRVVVRLHERDDLPVIDTRDVQGAPSDPWAFRRQIIHEDVMAVAVGRCVDEALAQAEAAQGSAAPQA
jgi:hypothetical protein